MLGPDSRFLEKARDLERAYLESDDPIMQSGFSGGRRRWVAERSPLVEAIHRNGDFLDVGCANGLLVKDVVAWAADNGFSLTPHGVDIGTGLVDLATERFPEHMENFHVANAWSWQPPRRWTFVYSLLDLSPKDLWCEWIRRLLGWVEPGGRLIIGSYGGRTPRLDPEPVGDVVNRCGFDIIGSSSGGDPLITRYAWTA